MTHPRDPDRLPDPLPLTGRDRELSTLLSLLEASSRETIGLVTGRGGVGKSRLLQAVVDEAEWRGWQIARGQSFPVESGLPYGIFGEAFLPLIDAMGPDRLKVLARGADTDFAAIFPTLGPVPAPAREDSEEFRSRLLWNFADFLGNLGKERPLLVVFDDIHWADEASLRLLHFLARRASGPRVRFLCSYNEVDRRSNPFWLGAERALLGLQEVRVVRLEDLGPGDVLTLLRESFETDESVVGGFASRLWDISRGNPWYIHQILRTLVQAGDLHRRDGIWLGWEARLVDLPPSVQDVVLRRVEGLPTDAGRLLDRLAVFGGAAGMSLLRRVVDLSDEALLEALETLVESGLVAESPSDLGSASYGIPHPIVRRAIYDRMSTARAQRLHGMIGDALEHLVAEGRRTSAHGVGRHLSQSDDPELRARAVTHLLEAGDEALRRHAVREALDDLRTAREILRSLPPALTSPLDAEGRARLHTLLGQAHHGVGQHRLALDSWEIALGEIDAENAAARVRLLVSVGSALLSLGEGRRALDTLSEAVEAAERSGIEPLVARARLARGGVLQELGRGDDARTDLEEALQRCGDDDPLRTEAHRALGMLYIWTGPHEEASRHLRLGLDLAERIGHAELRFWCTHGLAILEAMTGVGDEFDARLELATRIADALGSPILRLRVDELRIERAHAEGRWDAAVAIGEQAIATARALGQRAILARLLVWTSAIYLGRGDDERGRAFVDEACDLAGLGRDDASDIQTVVPAHIGLAHLHLVTGEYEDAIRVAERGLAIVEGTGYVLWALHRLLPILAEAHLWLEDTVGAERVGRRMRQHSARVHHPLGEIFADACDAMIVWKRGDPQGGIERMRAAADALEAVPMLPVAARIRRQMAGRLAEIGATDESVRELKRVHQDFLRMGLENELEKARIQFREIGVRPPNRSLESDGTLTDRELEIARLVAAGGSNKSVGKELGISPRTVSTHLTKIFQKLGVATRHDLGEALHPTP